MFTCESWVIRGEVTKKVDKAITQEPVYLAFVDPSFWFGHAWEPIHCAYRFVHVAHDNEIVVLSRPAVDSEAYSGGFQAFVGGSRGVSNDPREIWVIHGNLVEGCWHQYTDY